MADEGTETAILPRQLAGGFSGRECIYDAARRARGQMLWFGPPGLDPGPDAEAVTPASLRAERLLQPLAVRPLLGRSRTVLVLPPAWLLGDAWRCFAPGEVELAVDSQSVAETRVSDRICRLGEAGYRLALHTKGDEAWPPGWRSATVRVIVAAERLADPAFARTLSQWHEEGGSLLVTGVDTEADWDAARTIGGTEFMGTFPRRPVETRKVAMSMTRAQILPLLSRLHRPDCDLGDLERHIAQDATLSYALLRLVNSPFYGLTRPVDSVRRAIVYLGRDHIRHWVTLLALRAGDDPTAAAWLEAALIRARMCELLAEASGFSNREGFFTAGLFSALEPLMGMPLMRILGKLPLSDDINQALLHRHGPMGEALACACAFEQAMHQGRPGFGNLDGSFAAALYLNALRWAFQYQESLSAP